MENRATCPLNALLAGNKEMEEGGRTTNTAGRRGGSGMIKGRTEKGGDR